MNINLQNAIDSIKKIDNVDDIKELYYVVADRYKEFQRRKTADCKLSFSVGDQVNLKSECIKGKADKLYMQVGKITKTNRSKAVVLFNNGSWNIPYTMLEKNGDNGFTKKQINQFYELQG